MAKPIKEKKERGRPTIFNEATLQKLEQGFKIGLTDEECCAYAEIAMSSLYNYQNANPDFLDKKNKWKKNPVAKAKHTIYKNLDDPKTAQWYLERKCKEEFSIKVEQEVTNTTPQIVIATQTDADYLKKIADVKINKDVL